MDICTKWWGDISHFYLTGSFKETHGNSNMCLFGSWIFCVYNKNWLTQSKIKLGLVTSGLCLVLDHHNLICLIFWNELLKGHYYTSPSCILHSKIQRPRDRDTKSCDPNIFLHILFSRVKIRLHTKNQFHSAYKWVQYILFYICI